ncbi:energy transducer TonB [Luteimonas deserti]|uniref:Energy transducer TonB n=1 Tax=Luteimonas deserti TaxID=2752306 RepID=A0A7Z0QM86_9GAMM|nr:energy transducer TonB [Luteimonas deserti]NYZ61149.1 energy transducer TonB [Luteimonas deserti]
MTVFAGPVPQAAAQSATDLRQQMEASMLVTGRVAIDEHGHVTAHALDGREMLPPEVADLVDRRISGLRFDSLHGDGSTGPVNTTMSLRLLAMPGDDGTAVIRIASAYFGERPERTGQGALRVIEPIRPPRYPAAAAEIGGKGVVYLLIKIGRDGRLEDVAVEQVNLTALGTAHQMRKVRESLASSAVDTVRRHWSFAPPTEGPDAGRAYWVLRWPFAFSFDGEPSPAYGQWVSYHPGPVQRPAWAVPGANGASADALAGSSLVAGSGSPRLLTPLGD